MRFLSEVFGGYTYLIAYLVIINLIGFVAMWSDKRKAEKNKWRISEGTLMSICLMGGGIGTISGMYKFRHKTKKLKFTVGMPTILVAEILLLIYIDLKIYLLK